MTGIYSICHVASGKRYIGASGDITRRWARHRNLLRSNKHHSRQLQNAWNKRGESAFEFSVLEYCDGAKLQEREQHYLDQNPAYNVMKDAFSICPVVRAKIVDGIRRWAAKITHCPHGHEYNEQNTRWRGNSRICRACNVLRSNAASMADPEKRAIRLEQKRAAYMRAKCL